ncbi:MAG: hypothetical protein GXP55_23475 [Deltaproteobacteria bacterium]|nr:hypothetical protein [Deltaproteobacteria bacterium]
MRRRRVLWALGVIALLLGVGSAAVVPWLRGRVAQALAERLKMPCEVASVGLGFSELTVEGIRCGGSVQGVRLEVESLRLKPGLALAWGGSSALRFAGVTGVSVDLDTDGSAFRSWLERQRASRHRARSAGAGSRRRPALEVSRLQLRLRDEHGMLGIFQLAHASLDADGAFVANAAVELGDSAGGGELRLDDVSVRGTLGQGARGAAIDVGGGYVVASAGETSAPRLMDRCAASARIWADSAPDSAATGDAAVDAGGPVDGAWRRAWSSLQRGHAALLGAQLSLARFEIRVYRPGTDRVVVRELSARARFESDGLLLDGHGLADTGGALNWDLRLDPLGVRGEGSVSAVELPLDLFAPLLPSIPLTHAERGRLSLNLRLEPAAEEVGIEGDLTVLNAELTSPSVAAHPVRGLALSASGRATWSPAARRLRLEEVRLTEGRASLTISGSLEAPADHYAADLRVILPPTSCADALGAIPRDLLDDVADFSLEGRIAARVVLRLDSRDLEHTRLRVHVADGCRFTSVPAIADLRRVGGPFVHRALEPDGSVFEMTTGPGTAAWTPIRSISPFLVYAVVAHEDGAFFHHSGFAPWAIRDALVRDLEAGRYVTGASTISMQLAKNLFLQREKTLARKAQEVILTWWLEAARSKQGILELYLNLIEYGPGIYGIRAASRHYFGREPADLSVAEAVFLASILPAPKRFHALYVTGELSHSMAARMRRQLVRMAGRGQIDAVALADGESEIGHFRFARPGVPVEHEASGRAAALDWATDGAAMGDPDELESSDDPAEDAEYPQEFAPE